MSNKFIKDYFKNYIVYKNNLEYAVLLKGKWGSGKTFFIKKFIEEEKNVKFIYVSLFGLKTLEEVHEKIFEAFHPFLSSKKAKFLSSILKGAIKFGTKIEIEDFISIDKEVEKELEKYINVDINENKLIKNLFNYGFNKKSEDEQKDTNVIFVFDDFERCLIKTKHLFSLISDFVEQKGLKVILIGNEEEIEDEYYNKFKEKVIGKEFEINFNFEEAFFDFLEFLKDENTKRLLNDNYKLIKEIHNILKIKNLRILKQTFIEFEVFIIDNRIDEEYFKNKEFLTHLVNNFFAFVMWYKKTNSIEELEKLEKYFDDIEKQSIFKKKLNFQLSAILFGIEFWKNYLKKGLITTDVNEEIKKLAYFKYKTQPDWVKLWYYWKLEEEEFDELLEKVKKQFFECDDIFKNFYVLLHFISLLIFFSKKGFIDLNIKEIKNQLNSCINKFRKTDVWIKQKFLDFHNPTGLGYIAEDDKDFIEIENYLINEIKQIEKEFKLKQLREDIAKFINSLKEGSEENVLEIISKYEHMSFFDNFSDSQIDEIVSLPAKSLFVLNNIINYRFSDNYIFNGEKRYCLYVAELSFFEKLKKDLFKVLEKEKISNLKKLSLEYILINIDKGIKKLKECNEKTNVF